MFFCHQSPGWTRSAYKTFSVRLILLLSILLSQDLRLAWLGAVASWIRSLSLLLFWGHWTLWRMSNGLHNCWCHMRWPLQRSSLQIVGYTWLCGKTVSFETQPSPLTVGHFAAILVSRCHAHCLWLSYFGSRSSPTLHLQAQILWKLQRWWVAEWLQYCWYHYSRACSVLLLLFSR